MQTQCSSYADIAEAEAAVERLLADGMPPTRISIISGHTTQDERVGAYVGEAREVGAYAGTAGAMGSFATGSGDQRNGSFGDIDRDEVTTYENGTRHVRIASHHELEKRLVEAGLDAETAAADVARVHEGRVLVRVTSG